MNIQDQITELKRTLSAMLACLDDIANQLAARKNEDEHLEGCECDNCTTARADFNAWADDYNRRHPYPSNYKPQQGIGCCVADDATFKPCGPLCITHGDVRDHSAVRP